MHDEPQHLCIFCGQPITGTAPGLSWSSWNHHWGGSRECTPWWCIACGDLPGDTEFNRLIPIIAPRPS